MRKGGKKEKKTFSWPQMTHAELEPSIAPRSDAKQRATVFSLRSTKHTMHPTGSDSEVAGSGETGDGCQSLFISNSLQIQLK